MEHATADSRSIEAQLARKGLKQCRNIYGRKIGERIRYRTRQNNPIAMAQAAGVDDVWHISFTLCRLRPHERLACPGENLGVVDDVQNLSRNFLRGWWPHGSGRLVVFEAIKPTEEEATNERG
jgi:hypothetical protein